jgi:hypothetical protein
MHSQKRNIEVDGAKNAVIERAFCGPNGWHEHNLSAQQPTHAVSQQHDIGQRVLMRLDPVAETISGDSDVPSGAISRVNFGVNYMSVGEQNGQEAVDMRWETAETGFISHETVDEDAKKLSAFALLSVRRY